MTENQLIESKIIRRIIDRLLTSEQLPDGYLTDLPSEYDFSFIAEKLPPSEPNDDFLKKIPIAFFSDALTPPEFSEVVRSVLNLYFENDHPQLQNLTFLSPQVPDKIYGPVMVSGAGDPEIIVECFKDRYFYQILICDLGAKLIYNIIKDCSSHSNEEEHFQRFKYSRHNTLPDLDYCLDKVYKLFQDLQDAGKAITDLTGTAPDINDFEWVDREMKYRSIGELLIWVRAESGELHSILNGFQNIPNIVELYKKYSFDTDMKFSDSYWGDLNERIIKMCLDRYKHEQIQRLLVALMSNSIAKQKMYENSLATDIQKLNFSNRINGHIQALENLIYLKRFVPDFEYSSFEQLTDDAFIEPLIRKEKNEIDIKIKNCNSDLDRESNIEKGIKELKSIYEPIDIEANGSGKSIYNSIKGFLLSLKTSLEFNRKYGLQNSRETKPLAQGRKLDKDERLKNLIKTLSSEFQLIEVDQNQELFSLIKEKNCKKIKRNKISINCGPKVFAIIAENFKRSEWGNFNYIDIERSGLFISVIKKPKSDKPKDKIIKARDISTPLGRMKKKELSEEKEKIDNIFSQWK